MQENTKKKIIAIELVVLFIVSTVVVSIDLDKFDTIISSELDSPDTTQDAFVNQDGRLSSINEDIVNMIQQVDESMIFNYLDNIVSFGPHVTGTSTIEDVGNYIFNEFQSMGLDVRYQRWSARVPYIKRPIIWHGWYYGNNIEATLPGTDESSDEIYIIFAHYDSWRRSPGADDDGSGVAAVLSAAKIMSQYTFNHTIRFVTFSGEEQGLLGSHFYVEEAYDNNDNIIAALCADSIGYVETEDEGSKVRVFENEPSSWITDFTISVNQRYSENIDLEVIPKDDTTGYGSDYLNFWQFGYDAVFYHEIIMTDKRHSPKDTIENMNIPYATKIAKLMLATLAEFALSNQSEPTNIAPSNLPVNQQSFPLLERFLERFPVLKQILSLFPIFRKVLDL